MNGLAGIIEHIRADSNAKCTAIAQEAAGECERIRAEYSKTEQDEYWKVINAGTKSTEQRLERLNSLAALEAQKLIASTYQEMIDKAFSLAAIKLKALPKAKYKELLANLGEKENCSPLAFVSRFKEALSTDVTSALFE